MAINNFIPELWAAALLEVWWNETVFAALVNRDYEGEATRGNTVNITGVVVPTVRDYAAAGRTTNPEDITDTGIQLRIDQEKSTDFFVDDVDRAQALGSLSAYADAAGVALVEDSDKFIGSLLVTGGTPVTLSSNSIAGGGGTAVTGDDAFNVVKDIRKQLNKNAVPSAGRVCVMNAEFEGLLLQANSKLTTFYQADDTEGLRNATVGQLLGMRMVTSNNMHAAVRRLLAASRCVRLPDRPSGGHAGTDEVRGSHSRTSRLRRQGGSSHRRGRVQPGRKLSRSDDDATRLDRYSRPARVVAGRAISAVFDGRHCGSPWAAGQFGSQHGASGTYPVPACKAVQPVSDRGGSRILAWHKHCQSVDAEWPCATTGSTW
jgi:hypothetical protein